MQELWKPLPGSAERKREEATHKKREEQGRREDERRGGTHLFGVAGDNVLGGNGVLLKASRKAGKTSGKCFLWRENFARNGISF